MQKLKLIALLCVFNASWSYSQQLYILNRGNDNIVSVPIDAASEPLTEKINQNVLAAYDFVQNETDNKLIWTSTINHQILSAPLSEGGVGIPIDVGAKIPVDLEIDHEHQKLYWADNASNKIGYSNLDGTEPKDLPIEGILDLSSIALLPSMDLLFYADIKNSQIWSCNLNGTNCKVFVEGGDMASPVRLLIDPLKQKLYWADDLSHRIERINLDGSSREVFYQGGDDELPFGLLLDSNNEYLYWTDYRKEVVMRTHISGVDPTVFISAGLKDPVALLLVKDTGGRPEDRADKQDLDAGKPAVTAYPNPANNTLLLKSANSDQEIEQLCILGEMGQEIFSSKPGQKFTQIDTANYPEGHYIYYVTIKGQLLGGHFSIIHN